MAHLYPSLHEKFKSEGLCPICLMEMAYAPRFSCVNSHVICHRCRPYYYSCPQCLQPLSEVAASSPGPYDPPPPTHMMPHPPHLPRPYPPSAPDLRDFHDHERQQHHLHGSWNPPSPPREDQELLDCPYAHLGCMAKFVPLLRDMHVSRCQYKQHSSEQLPPCKDREDSERMPCRYQSVGCNVRAAHWRLRTHEDICIYKERSCSEGPVASVIEELGEHLQGSCRVDEDPNRMVECRFRGRGCMVRMPLWRKQTHESKCNYAHHEEAGVCDDFERHRGYCGTMPQPLVDPEEQTDCRWAEFGCRVRPKYCRKELHEDKCNYRMEECAFKNRGCCELFQPSRRYAHENSCTYAY